ncbi:MAG: DUF5661 family protein [Clostridiaceae bacterium]
MRFIDKRSFNDNVTFLSRKSFTAEEAMWIANFLGIRFDKFDIEQFRVGLNVELEHGTVNPATNITNDDPILTGKITLAHLNEFPDYYNRLAKMEEEAEKYWEKKE